MTRETLLSLLAHGLPNLHELAKALWTDLGDVKSRRHDDLKSLIIGGTFHAAEDYQLLLPFLETCTRKLDTFEIEGVNWVHQPQVNQALSRLGVSLTEIMPCDMTNGCDSTDAEIAKYIGLSIRWTSYNLEMCHAAGSLTVLAIQDCCDRLEQLVLTGCGLISSHELLLILRKAAHLKTFVALLSDKDSGTNDPVITGTELIALEWASLSLVGFWCKIEVPRLPYQDEGDEGSSEGNTSAVESSRHIQCQVFSKLGEQKSLRSLGFGSHYRGALDEDDHRFQKQCLEMTLESGLDAPDCRAGSET
ncbi:hypothetical protein BGZ74_000490 [Mortierella antarctica]|nr:hypothetical protein BGZ74_000490 [Mortierella antarctica]